MNMDDESGSFSESFMETLIHECGIRGCERRLETHVRALDAPIHFNKFKSGASSAEKGVFGYGLFEDF